MCPLKAHASRCSAPAPHSVSGPESLQTYLTQMSLHWGGAGPNLMSLVSLEKGEIGAEMSTEGKWPSVSLGGARPSLAAPRSWPCSRLGCSLQPGESNPGALSLHCIQGSLASPSRLRSGRPDSSRQAVGCPSWLGWPWSPAVTGLPPGEFTPYALRRSANSTSCSSHGGSAFLWVQLCVGT